MKRTAKILSVLLTLLVAVTVIGCIALAASSGSADTGKIRTAKAPEKEGYFLYYDASASSKYSLKKNSDFATTVNSMANGDVIKLLSDVTTMSSTGSPILQSSSATTYIDLNGYALSFEITGKEDGTTYYVIKPKINCKLHIYSSDKENTAGIYTSSNGSESLFNVRYNNTEIHLGGTGATPVLTYSDTNFDSQPSYSTSNVLTSGDNIVVFTDTLLDPYYNTKTETAPVGAKFFIDGGTYYSTSNSSLMAIGSIETNVSNATFISTATDGSILGLNGIHANLTAKNSVFYCNGTALKNIKADDGVTVKFTDCYIHGSELATVHSENSSLPIFENCHFESSYAFLNSGAHVVVKNNTKKMLPLAVATPVITDGNITSWNVYDLGEKMIIFSAATVAPNSGKTVDINWKSPEGTVTETWLKGEDIIPLPYFSNKISDVYTYDYSPKISTTDKIEGGSITYTLTPRINFTVRANLSLQAEFVYNLYVPTRIVDSTSFRWARIDSKLDGVFEEGAFVDFASCATKTIAISDTLTEECYVITKSILANDGDNEYRLVLNLDGFYAEGEITHVQNFSIPDYVERVNDAGFDKVTTDMVNAALTYIKAARNYESGEIGDALPYPLTDFSAISGIAYQNKNSSNPSAEVSQAVNSFSLLLADKVMFSFLIESSYLDAGNTITFGYQVYGRGTETVVSKTQNAVKEGEYYRVDIPVYAVDLLKYVKIDLSSTGKGDDYRYGLLNYVEAKYNPDSDSTLNMLLDAIYAYGVATYTYATTPESDTPAVELTIGANKKAVTAENYVIVASGGEVLQAAEALRAAIYAKTGEELQIVGDDISGKSSIKLITSTPCRTYDFRVRVSGDDLLFDCPVKSYVNDAMTDFVLKHLPVENSKSFEDGFAESYYTDRIYYSDFGIEGVDLNALPSEYRDLSIWHGEKLAEIRSLLHNSFYDIRDAHTLINGAARPHTICADPDAVYYISENRERTGKAAASIVIESSVDFGNAAFIIDDNAVNSIKKTGTGVDNTPYNMAMQHLFKVKSSYEKLIIDDEAVIDSLKINENTKKINLGLGYSAMIIPIDETPDSHKIYRRRGHGNEQWKGQVYTEVILIDENGKIDPSTPVLFNYENITAIEVYRADLPEITINGGTFYTVESDFNYANPNSPTGQKLGAGIKRGIEVTRSNTVIQNLKHKVIGEFTLAEQNPDNVIKNDASTHPKLGSTYVGFFTAERATNVTFLGCELEGRRAYAYKSAESSYEITVDRANNVTFDSCIQTNFYIDGDTGLDVTENTTNKVYSMKNNICWGACQSNYCKNLNYVDSTISRYDAHNGLCNGKIIGSTLNGIEIIGFGEMLIQDSKIYAYTATSALFALRNDYGNHWDGTVKIKNLDFYPYETEEYNYADGTATFEHGYEVYLVGHAYTNWYYGYKSHFPNVVIDGLEFYSTLSNRMITPYEMGPIKLVSDNASFMKQNDLHLDYTKGLGNSYADAIIAVVDADGDGYIDGTQNIYPDGKIITNDILKNKYFDTDGDGIADNGIYIVQDPAKGIPIADFKGAVENGMRIESNINLNPIQAPNKIAITDSVGYDYETIYNKYFEITTFLDDTLIYVEKLDKNGELIERVVINGEYIDFIEDFVEPPADFTNPDDSPFVDYQ